MRHPAPRRREGEGGTAPTSPRLPRAAAGPVAPARRRSPSPYGLPGPAASGAAQGKGVRSGGGERSARAAGRPSPSRRGAGRHALALPFPLPTSSVTRGGGGAGCREDTARVGSPLCNRGGGSGRAAPKVPEGWTLSSGRGPLRRRTGGCCCLLWCCPAIRQALSLAFAPVGSVCDVGLFALGPPEQGLPTASIGPGEGPAVRERQNSAWKEASADVCKRPLCRWYG